MYVFGIGIVWTLLQIATFKLQGISFSWNQISLGYGLVSGLLLTLSNILLLESLTHIDISFGSTVYRLNTIGVVILSFLALHESLGVIKIFGILCGLTAVLLLFKKENMHPKQVNFTLFYLAAITASMIRATYGVVTKMGMSAKADPNVMLILIALSWIAGGALYAKLREKRFVITVKKTVYSVVSGILVYFIVNFLLLAVKNGEASTVIPIANMSFIFALLISILLKMEVLTLRKCCAVGLAVSSIILLIEA